MSDLTLLLDDLISCGNKLTETAQALKSVIEHFSFYFFLISFHNHSILITE